MATRRSTPCVGICSTTYGDLVCRGCKRFAHEISQWNAYAPDQREVVWQRLEVLRAGAVTAALDLTHPQVFREAVTVYMRPRTELTPAAGVPSDWPLLAYDLLRHVVRNAVSWSALGLMPHEPGDPLALLKRIDAEVYQRSLAHYERSFRISAV